MKKDGARGFTLIEILLVIGLIAILAAIVIVAVNPTRQLGKAQNAQRRSDVRAILDAINQYAIDNNGSLPSGIPVGTNCITHDAESSTICKVDSSCGGVVLDALVSSDTYLSDLPEDPTGATSQDIGYKVIQNSNGRVSVCAPTTYGGETINVTR